MHPIRDNPLTTETSLVFDPGLQDGEAAPVVSFRSILDGVFDDDEVEDEESSA